MQPTTVDARSAPPTSRATVLRADIQALRALAVTLVVVYHLFPTGLRGGFVGVDVFLVISGFLISSHLFARPPRTLRGLGEFWTRRIRRLLPASFLVLAVTLVATRIVAPSTLWATTATEVIASALYVQNWQLARTSVDYLAAEGAASPVQHFWSLSVEEQFYVVWPVLLLVVLAVRRKDLTRRSLLGLTAVITAVSVVVSVWQTAVEPASAYFSTPARIWEFGFGALLAAWASGPRREATGERIRPWHRSLLALVGLGLIVFSAFWLHSGAPFPGWRALVPVTGAALVIAAGTRAGRGAATGGVFGPLVAARPIQWLGDVSYSVYLWHWPLIILLPFVSGPFGLLDYTALVVATLGLAWVTKVFVEDRFRRGRTTRPIMVPLLAMGTGMALIAALGTLQHVELSRRAEQAQQRLEDAVSQNGECFGAAALASGPEQCPPTTSGEVFPAPETAKDDKPSAYTDDCWTWAPYDKVKTCQFGDPDAEVQVALYGNSHAGHWLPALELIAESRGWGITTYLASICPGVEIPLNFDTEEKSDGCMRWSDEVVETIGAKDYDLVITSVRSSFGTPGKKVADSQPALYEGYRDYLERWQQTDHKLLVIRDTPFPGSTKIPDCVAQNPDDYTACSDTREEWLPPDPMLRAAEDAEDPDIATADFTDLVCAPERCYGVNGQVITYFDGSHLSATYSQTLAPAVAEEVTEAMR